MDTVDFKSHNAMDQIPACHGMEYRGTYYLPAHRSLRISEYVKEKTLLRYPEIFHSLEVVHQAGNPSRVRLFTAMYSSVNRSTVHVTPISWKILARPRICRISCPNTLNKSCPRRKSGSGAISACSRENVSQRNRLYVMILLTRVPQGYTET